MPDGLYERDILAWSEIQADLLRRLSRGERVNDVDWGNVVEEIESVGLSELNSVRSFLRQMITHLLKVRFWPDSLATNHWYGEIVNFQTELADRFSPSMRQRIDLDKHYRDAVRRLKADGVDLAVLAENPFTLDQLLTENVRDLLNRLPSRP